MLIASYPATFLPEDEKGFHVRFPDFPGALTRGDDLEDTLVQAGTAWLRPLPDGSPAGRGGRTSTAVQGEARSASH